MMVMDVARLKAWLIMDEPRWENNTTHLCKLRTIRNSEMQLGYL